MRQKNVARKIGAGILFIIFSLLFLLLVFRFGFIQITGKAEGRVLASQVAEKYLKSSVLKANRGTIYDRNGKVIAEETASYKLVAILDDSVTADKKNPKHVDDPKGTAKILAEYIEMSEEDILERLSQEESYQVEFGSAGREISQTVKNAIDEEKLPGITFVEQSKRLYPNGIFSSHLIGFAQKEEIDNKTVTVGKMGIESSLNDVLTGKDGKLEYQSDSWGYLLPNGEELVTAPEHGNEVYLTTDTTIQTFLEDALSKVEEEYEPEKMIAIVANPKTGAILGMSQRPSFHPDTREGLENWSNEVVESAFEPGSTMKSFTLAAAVDTGVFDPNDTYQSGEYKVDGVPKPIQDHNNGEGWGKISYLEGVQRSSNVAFAYLLEKMGEDTYLDYLNKFHFGQPTGIGLPNEASGTVLYKYPIEKVTTAFGQGTTLTPLQIIQAETAIANDGKMMKPYVIDKIVDPNTDKVITKNKPTIVGEPISADTAKKVREYLETTVTSDRGTGRFFNIDGYQVSGKSGTAQVVDPETGSYISGDKEAYIFSFLGMAPSDDPQLIVYVAIQQPEIPTGEYGSTVVSKVFNPVMQNSLKYLNIQSEKEINIEEISVPDTKGQSVAKYVERLQALQLDPIVIGEGTTIKSMYPSSGQKVLAGEKIIIKTEGETVLPDLKGWSIKDVLKVANVAELKLDIIGSGFAVKQTITPSSIVNKGDPLTVTFQSPNETKEKKESTEEDEQATPIN
ncbi:penicillin-binding protein [Bacillus spongiae]|uniref:serine-type D-Ala-D-Ala carboxypeptidase n=1 Tax=Bacillus spongiae TaxID=2683610 RepID=A0ABU8HA99_9BACI